MVSGIFVIEITLTVVVVLEKEAVISLYCIELLKAPGFRGVAAYSPVIEYGHLFLAFTRCLRKLQSQESFIKYLHYQNYVKTESISHHQPYHHRPAQTRA